jgi:hypothetical protein
VTEEPSKEHHAGYSSAERLLSAERRFNAVADEINGLGQKAASTSLAGSLYSPHVRDGMLPMAKQLIGSCRVMA